MHYLESQGMKILERNFRCRTGEIDLIARDGTCFCGGQIPYDRSLRFSVRSCERAEAADDPQGGGGLSAYQKADRL